MPKQKSHKGLLKRIKITAHGKIKHKRMGASHLMSGTRGQKAQSLRRPQYCPTTVAKKLERALHMRLKGRQQD
jgi:large subunit ribosomal protein L35